MVVTKQIYEHLRAENKQLRTANAVMLAALKDWANAEQARSYIPERERSVWDRLMAHTRAAIAKADGKG